MRGGWMIDIVVKSCRTVQTVQDDKLQLELKLSNNGKDVL